MVRPAGENGTVEGALSLLSLHLQRLGIVGADQLLAACGTRADRYGLSRVLGVDIGQLVELVNRADLGRVPCLDDDNIDLLARAGVHTLEELAASNPAHLHARLQSTAGEDSTTPPTLDQLRQWIEQARHLPRRVWD